MGRDAVRILLAVAAVGASVGWSGVAVAADEQCNTSGPGPGALVGAGPGGETVSRVGEDTGSLDLAPGFFNDFKPPGC
jgi:hypothetical protein